MENPPSVQPSNGMGAVYDRFSVVFLQIFYSASPTKPKYFFTACLDKYID